MTKHIKHILQGARQVLVLIPAAKYVVPSKHGFARDVAELRKDSKRVARDFNKTLSKYGK
jgi:hypothetical protein